MGEPWCNSHLKLLTPEDWFLLHEVDQPRLWVPPPAAMQTVLELFSEDPLVNPHIPHVFIVPRLMTCMWRKALSKDADLMFTVACGTPFWLDDMFEPLIIAIVLPLTHLPNFRGPWMVKGTDEATSLGKRLDRGSYTGPREDMTQTNCMSWKGTCQVCGKLQTNGAGIFCSNFLLARDPFPRATISGAGNVT